MLRVADFDLATIGPDIDAAGKGERLVRRRCAVGDSEWGRALGCVVDDSSGSMEATAGWAGCCICRMRATG